MDAAQVQSQVAEVAQDFAADRPARQLRRHLDKADFDRLAEAGFLLTLAGSPGQEAARLLVDRQALRLEDGGEILIYRRDKNLLWSLNAQERSYAEFTPEGAPGR